LGTAGPAALAIWALDVVGFDLFDPDLLASGDLREPRAVAGVGLSFFFLLAGLGLIVAIVESRTLALGILGGVVADRPVSVREAVARSRRTFWRAIGVGILVSIPLLIAQNVVEAVMRNVLGQNQQFSLLTSTVVSALVGGTLAHLLVC